MPYSKIVLTNSVTPGAEPNPLDLSVGELAVNVVDGKLFTKNDSDNLVTLSDSGLEGRVTTLEQNPGTWGSISGVLSTQSDLQTLLDSKSNIDDVLLSTSNVTGGTKISLSTSDTESTDVSLLSDNLTVTQTNKVVNIEHKTTIRNDSTVSYPIGFGNTVDIVTGVTSNSLGHLNSVETTSLTFPSLPNYEERISALEYEPIDITSFAVSPITTFYEYGDTGYSPLTLSWDTNKPTETLTLFAPGATHVLNTLDTSYIDTYTVTPSVGTGIPSTKTWSLIATDDQSAEDTVTKSLVFGYPFYYGDNANNLSSGTNIGTLNKLVESKGNKTVNINTNSEFIYFAYPSYYGDLTTILDGNGFNVTNSFTKSVSPITHTLTGGTVEYIIYKSNSVNTVNQNFQFKF